MVSSKAFPSLSASLFKEAVNLRVVGKTIRCQLFGLNTSDHYYNCKKLPDPSFLKASNYRSVYVLCSFNLWSEPNHYSLSNIS